ncbi:RNA-binding protein, putative [Plasmodium sp. gorilla clade G2]|uniref:RNA-binding protein, putative n=1 Tax=Plasmodium sp. gorilla clade G2 TaxID=880535 RepID=UPI000D21E69E|nr:RNA-binding protein, putative [Plasmodium sp. gorilla clade G2]SOV11687.1 RNA-binding protein, putative [Plasmodium sp. gorilla clade G2]
MSLKRFFNFLDDDNKTKKKINTNKNEVDDDKIINDETKYKEEDEQEKGEHEKEAELQKEEKKGGKRRGRKKQTDDKKNDHNDESENHKIDQESQPALNQIEEEKKDNDNKKKRGRKSKKDIDINKGDINKNDINKGDTNKDDINKGDTNNDDVKNNISNNKEKTDDDNNLNNNIKDKENNNEDNNLNNNIKDKENNSDDKNLNNNIKDKENNSEDNNLNNNIKDKENNNEDKNCKKIHSPNQILSNTPPPPIGNPPTGIQNISHNLPPVPPNLPPPPIPPTPPSPPAPPGQLHQSNYPSQYYNMYNNMSVENYMGYPYYYSQYYNVAPHQSTSISIDPNKDKQLNNNNNSNSNNNNNINNVVDGGRVKNDLLSTTNNYDKDINTDENNKNMSIYGNNISNYYMNNPINNYYNMYNYNYMTGMNNVNTINPMTYNYYYDGIGMYDNNKMVDENVFNYCSILDKSIELMKKSDKVKEILKTPARLQITQEELNKIEYTEGNEQYNIWFGKYVTDRYDKSVKGSSTPRFVAKYKCNPTKDSGYTKADKSYTSKQYFCIYFARGCCAYGHNCLYKHRIPNENDELEFEASVDIFGREKFNTFKDDMTGVGSFNNDCRTLFIGSIFINNINQVPIIEKILYEEFLPFGNIEYVRYIPNKNIAFIQFTNRVNAEFAKIAMSDQPIENYSTALTIKWAFEFKNQTHNVIQYYNNPYIYGNTNQVISSTWENYIMQQQYGNHPMYTNMNHMYNNTNIYPIDNNNINSNSNSALANASLSEHQKKINDRSANLNNSLNKIDQMFDIQN